MKLLIVNRSQFGYHLDSYYYCRLAPENCQVTYLGCDSGAPLIPSDKTNVITVPKIRMYLGSKFQYIRFMYWASKHIRHGNFDVVMLKYFPWCLLLRLLHPQTIFLLDIRTGSVHTAPIRRWVADAALRFESSFFRHISVISRTLADRLKIPHRKRYILPLGANPLSDCRQRDLSQLNLLYVGTFNRRRIDDTLRGVMLCRQAHPEIRLHYRLVGNGQTKEVEKLQKLAEDPLLKGLVEFSGYVHHQQLQEYWHWANVGISYVPITPIYEVQPPTKTFEYLAAGMPVLATATGENQRIVTSDNGLLIRDTPEAFAIGLWTLYQQQHRYDFRRIQQSIATYSWNEIVSHLFHRLENMAQPDFSSHLSESKEQK